ncbi:uncharacterized protein BDZ83DRAFT_641120 [Colletotrichum acutatum]|uniref:Uncharacterized protein n=1 Tax=Glomerella acutata TaxID=27357 RepID=A0AAD8XBL2_GLOAC|nr:uncharacterized protein BDZ83DRAFT_641120 [Colletotrichum acutatum]KAK1709717.1 hypothetical protein BDZ83DRAFT_641120 [Colletotrichum acutatum]
MVKPGPAHFNCLETLPAECYQQRRLSILWNYGQDHIFFQLRCRKVLKQHDPWTQ